VQKHPKLLFLLATLPMIVVLMTSAARSQAPSARADKNSGARAPASQDRLVPVQPPEGYRVGADDELAISVWHEPELSQSIVVRPDGMITLPLLNDIKVVGLSTVELQALLTEKLKTLVNDPQVTIVVKNIRSLKVFLVGSVAKQGMYPLNAGMTVLELITEGGGLGPFAKSNAIYILRTVDGKRIRIGFNYKKAIQGKGENPVLKSGDMVVVP
jgi:polysaccharide biosynthesis/export protein